MHRAEEVYTSDAESKGVFLALGELFSGNPYSMSFGIETLSKLIYEEPLHSYRAAVHEIECALVALDVERGAA